MDEESKIERLIAAGYQVGEVKDLLGLDDEDMKRVEELRVELREESNEMNERRVTNRVSENTVINSKNALQFFDGDLGIVNPEAGVFHNGTQLEVGTHYEFIENQDPGSGMRSLSLKVKIQLQPNDHFRVG